MIRRDPGRGEACAYGIGSFGTGLFSTVPAVLLLYFCTEELAMAPAIASLIVLAPKLVSMIWDPAVGQWSDGSGGRFGRRRPFLLAGAVGVSLGFVLLFAPPVAGPWVTAAWVGTAYMILAGFYSLFAVPYSALPAELSASLSGTARLTSTRMGFVMIGIFAGAVVAPAVVALAGGGRAGYATMGYVLGLGSFVALLAPIAVVAAREKTLTQAQRAQRAPQPPLTKALLEVWKDRDFRRLAIAFLFIACAFGAVSSALPYVVSKALGRSDIDIGLALGVMVGASIVALPVWDRVASRLGHASALRMAALGYGLAAAMLAFGLWRDLGWGFGLAAIGLAGSQFAGLQLMPFTLATEHLRRVAGAAEARYMGVWTSVEKLGLALGAALLGLVMAGASSVDATLLAGFLAAVPTFLSLLTLSLVRKSVPAMSVDDANEIPSEAQS